MPNSREQGKHLKNTLRIFFISVSILPNKQIFTDVTWEALKII